MVTQVLDVNGNASVFLNGQRFFGPLNLTAGVALGFGNEEVGADWRGGTRYWGQGAIDELRIYARALTDEEVLDLFNSYPSAATLFYTLTPCRIFDTRNASGSNAAAPALGAGETRLFAISGRCGLSAAAKALSVNVTVADPGAAGELVLFPEGTAPVASTISFGSGRTRASNTVLKLAGDGSGTFKVMNRSAAQVHFILDVNGLFQ
jgi:hypothetical protein